MQPRAFLLAHLSDRVFYLIFSFSDWGVLKVSAVSSHLSHVTKDDG